MDYEYTLTERQAEYLKLTIEQRGIEGAEVDGLTLRCTEEARDWLVSELEEDASESWSRGVSNRLEKDILEILT